MSPDSLPLVSAGDARSCWNRTVGPAAKAIGFKPGKTALRGWIKAAPRIETSFGFQITQFGFNRRTGGRFIVEFAARDPTRQTSLLCRMYRLLGDADQAELIRLNNRAIAALPEPDPEMVRSLPEFLRDTYLANFRPIRSIPDRAADVWCRYATADDVQAWGDFVSSRLAGLVEECERRLDQQETGTATMAGFAVKQSRNV